MLAAALVLAAALSATLSPVPACAQAPQPAPANAAASPAPSRSALVWTFDAAPAAGGGWTAERGTITMGGPVARLQPDSNRRVVLLSPPGLPDAARTAEEFVIGVAGTGLQRVRIQGRRDARGGWITLADAAGSKLREVPGGFAVSRKTGARDAPIERIRVELEFRTTNPRELRSITAR